MEKMRINGVTGDWVKCTLGDVVEKYEDPVPTPHNGYTRLGVRSHAKGTFYEYVAPGQELVTAKMHKVAKDKLIFNITFAWEHAVAVTNKDDEGKLVSHRFPQFTLCKQIVPGYLKYLVLNDSFRQHLLISSPGGAGRNRVLKIDEALKYEIILPPIEEQEAFAKILNSLDAKIASEEIETEKLKNLKSSMLTKMFPKEGEKVPEIRFDGFTDDWEQRKLGELADIVGGGTPSTGVSDYWDGDIDWYAPAEIAEQIYLTSSQRKITEEGYNHSSAKMLPVGTVLFTSRAGIGKTAILTQKGCTNQGFQSIVPHKSELDSYFIFSRTEELKQYGETVGAGSTFVEVSGKQMANMELMMPKTMAEQKTIGQYFANLDNLIILHQRKYEKLLDVKKAMLSKLIGGAN